MGCFIFCRNIQIRPSQNLFRHPQSHQSSQTSILRHFNYWKVYFSQECAPSSPSPTFALWVQLPQTPRLSDPTSRARIRRWKTPKEKSVRTLLSRLEEMPSSSSISLTLRYPSHHLSPDHIANSHRGSDDVNYFHSEIYKLLYHHYAGSVVHQAVVCSDPAPGSSPVKGTLFALERLNALISSGTAVLTEKGCCDGRPRKQIQTHLESSLSWAKTISMRGIVNLRSTTVQMQLRSKTIENHWRSQKLCLHQVAYSNRSLDSLLSLESSPGHTSGVVQRQHFQYTRKHLRLLHPRIRRGIQVSSLPRFQRTLALSSFCRFKCVF